jgi:hypothetical protein
LLDITFWGKHQGSGHFFEVISCHYFSTGFLLSGSEKKTEKNSWYNDQYIPSLFDIQQWSIPSTTAGCGNLELHNSCTFEVNGYWPDVFQTYMSSILLQKKV